MHFIKNVLPMIRKHFSIRLLLLQETSLLHIYTNKLFYIFRALRSVH